MSFKCQPNEFQLNISKINDKCLRSGLKLQTNLADIGGKVMIPLIQSLNNYSMPVPNMRIIERIMYQSSGIFRSAESINKIMKKDIPVNYAFTILGNSSVECNIKWLINLLYKLQEIEPLKRIMSTAPPTIIIQSPKQINPGQYIYFKVCTISKGIIQWWNYSKGIRRMVREEQIPELYNNVVEYKTLETDSGCFYIVVICDGEFKESSNCVVYVGSEKFFDEERNQSFKIESVVSNDENLQPPSTIQRTDSLFASVPARESDGKRRIALLIGIMSYTNPNLKPLKAPYSDILDLERVLLSIGFTVYCFGDLIKDQLIKVIENFLTLYTEEDSYVFFYFAGHGTSIEKVDHLILLDDKISAIDVIKMLYSPNPKLLVTIFDMCRTDDKKDNNSEIIMEAIIPHAENLAIVNSTLPKRRAFEKSVGYENSSMLMEPLCECLITYASKFSFCTVLGHLKNFCNFSEQICTVNFSGCGDKIGIDLMNPRIMPKIEWIEEPEDSNLYRRLTVEFETFHNMLKIYVENKSDEVQNFKTFIRPTSLRVRRDINDPDNIKINLFKFGNELRSSNYCVDIDFGVRFYNSESNKKYPIKIIIPPGVKSFL